jgi:hypothetical protein
LLSIPTGDRYPALNLTPQKRKEKTLHAQVAQVEGLAARQPVLMVYEDMHWSDAPTRESLDLLIDRVPTLHVLAIITFRPQFAPPWVGHPHVTMLNLNRLPPRRRAEMIMQVTGGKALPKEIADQIVDRPDGVRLFIEELTKSVVESGVLTETDGHYTLTGPVASRAILQSYTRRSWHGLIVWRPREHKHRMALGWWSIRPLVIAGGRTGQPRCRCACHLGHSSVACSKGCNQNDPDCLLDRNRSSRDRPCPTFQPTVRQPHRRILMPSLTWGQSTWNSCTSCFLQPARSCRF